MSRVITRPLNPASSRLLSVPPRHYDIIDGDTEAVLDSDLGARLVRSRSLARSRGSELRDGWRHPGYSDLVVGSRAHPGHRFPRWGHLSLKWPAMSSSNICTSDHRPSFAVTSWSPAGAPAPCRRPSTTSTGTWSLRRRRRSTHQEWRQCCFLSSWISNL